MVVALHPFTVPPTESWTQRVPAPGTRALSPLNWSISGPPLCRLLGVMASNPHRLTVGRERKGLYILGMRGNEFKILNEFNSSIFRNEKYFQISRKPDLGSILDFCKVKGMGT